MTGKFLVANGAQEHACGRRRRATTEYDPYATRRQFATAPRRSTSVLVTHICGKRQQRRVVEHKGAGCTLGSSLPFSPVPCGDYGGVRFALRVSRSGCSPQD